jgi:hypothetical protein
LQQRFDRLPAPRIFEFPLGSVVLQRITAFTIVATSNSMRRGSEFPSQIALVSNPAGLVLVGERQSKSRHIYCAMYRRHCGCAGSCWYWMRDAGQAKL